MLDMDHNIKIVDFGFAAQTEGRDASGKNRTYLGTPNYMAPEIHEGKAYRGAAVDLFALGIIIFELLAGHPPFDKAINEDKRYKKLIENKSNEFWRETDE